MGDKKFGDEGGAGVQHQQRGAGFHSGGIRVGVVRGGSHSVKTGGGSSKSERCQEL